MVIYITLLLTTQQVIAQQIRLLSTAEVFVCSVWKNILGILCMGSGTVTKKLKTSRKSRKTKISQHELLKPVAPNFSKDLAMKAVKKEKYKGNRVIIENLHLDLSSKLGLCLTFEFYTYRD